MDFLKYRNARHFLEETGFTVEKGLELVKRELKELEKETET